MTIEMIDVKELIAKYNHEEHARRADEYFANVPQDFLGATKPFSSPDIALNMLSKCHAMLYNARLFPGVRVLDFGAGGGWLSRVLATMGAKVTTLDISIKALEIAKKIDELRLDDSAKKNISYLAYDGLRIDVPDGSFDRILCFDAFHHVAISKQL